MRRTPLEELGARLVDRFEPLWREERHLIPTPKHVDWTVFGALPIEIYMQTGDMRGLALGEWMAQKQWGHPYGDRIEPRMEEFRAKGHSWQTRLWIDDMFMITAVQAQAFRATGDRAYIDGAASEMVFYLDELQKPDGLFFHTPEAPFFWGRGNGWMAAGMANLLRWLPADNPDRPRIMEAYRLMMASLLRHQAESGMWMQLIDGPESWPETSSTAMFTFAFITGVKEGWLDAATYGPAARKGWLRAGYLPRRRCEPAGGLRGHWRAKQPAVLSRSTPDRRRFSRPSACALVCERASALSDRLLRGARCPGAARHP